MFKFINALGRLVVRMYTAEARRAHKMAKVHSVASEKLVKKSDEIFNKSIEEANKSRACIDHSANVSMKAIQLASFFEA